LTKTTSARLSAPLRIAALSIIVLPVLAACGGAGNLGATVKRDAFSSKEFGVAVSPRVTTNLNPPKGGGRYLVGKPYTVRGVTYTPKEDPGYQANGGASWYGSDFHGRRTANGEIFSANAITGAHPTMPLPSYARVTNVENGRSVVVRVNDRGPYLSGRVMDLSHRAADILGYVQKGVGNIHVQYIGPAPLEGDDTRMLMASVNAPTRMEQGRTMFAMANPTPASRGGAPSNIGDLVTSLFGYAEASPAGSATGALGAAVAMSAGEAAPWQDNLSAEPLDISLVLGAFPPERATELAIAFARLAAVDEAATTVSGQKATTLTLSRLKPGATRGDVVQLARELGLKDIVLY
jgi:rare lipoprotein A